MEKSSRYRTLAILSAATFLPAGIAVGMLSGSTFKLINPDNIDVWQPLAYLGQAIVPGAAVAVLLATTCLTCLIIAYKNRQSIKLPAIILAINFPLMATMLISQNLTRTAEDDWARKNGGMTHEERGKKLDEFFKNAE